MTMILSRGFLRNTVIRAQNVHRITPEIVQVDCPECGGDGDWTKYHPEPDLGPFPCVECKGTGRVYA